MRSAAVKMTLSAFFLILTTMPAFSQVFEYKHIQGAQYRILSVVDEAVYINNALSHRAEILNRISVDVINVNSGGSALHSVVFQVSERIIYDSLQSENSAAASFQWSSEYKSEFERSKLGILTIAPEYFMPVVRNVPTFPGRNLSVGDRWYSEGHEVHDFRESFGIPEPYYIPFNAFYEYLGEREWKGVKYPSFSITYNIESRPQAVRGNLYPIRISGTFNQLVYWDLEAGHEKAYTEEFRLTFTMSNGVRIEFRGTAQAEYIDAETMDRDQMVTDIIEEIDKLDIPNVQVTATDEGISISLENIQFQADTDIMLPGELEKLEVIADILRRYPDRDIIVAGHTALAGTAQERMQLSTDRARSVADFLLSRNVRTPDRVVIRGYGGEQPIADNDTAEGMARNRRVEIILLEN